MNCKNIQEKFLDRISSLQTALKTDFMVQMICHNNFSIQLTYVDLDSLYKIYKKYNKGIFLYKTAF